MGEELERCDRRGGEVLRRGGLWEGEEGRRKARLVSGKGSCACTERPSDLSPPLRLYLFPQPALSLSRLHSLLTHCSCFPAQHSPASSALPVPHSSPLATLPFSIPFPSSAGSFVQPPILPSPLPPHPPPPLASSNADRTPQNYTLLPFRSLAG